MIVSPFAGKPATPEMLVNVPALVTAHFAERPDPAVPAQRVAFGTSGHRGSALEQSFNEWHILAISQAICLYRKQHRIDGPLYLGMDTHALSVPACASAIEVMAANGVSLMLADRDEYTPTPAVSHAILRYNRGRTSGLADGVVITPSHNPPDDGGFKYNPPHGGPAEPEVTRWIEAKANELLDAGLRGVNRIPYGKALRASTTRRHDYLTACTRDLVNVLDMEAIRGAGINMGVDGVLDRSLGFAGEESAGASFARLDGGVRTTDRDGIVAALLEALSPEHIPTNDLTGERIQTILTSARGDGVSIGGVEAAGILWQR